MLTFTFEPIRYEDYKDLSTYDLASKVEEMIKEKVSEFRLNQPDMVELLKMKIKSLSNKKIINMVCGCT